MMRDWLADQGLTLGPGFALLLFLVIFMGVLAWVFRPGSRRIYQEEAKLPLQDGTEGHPSEAGARKKRGA